jgi:hypothetical protein
LILRFAPHQHQWHFFKQRGGGNQYKVLAILGNIKHVSIEKNKFWGFKRSACASELTSFLLNIQEGDVGPRSGASVPRLEFFRKPCKILEPNDNPFREKSNQFRGRKRGHYVLASMHKHLALTKKQLVFIRGISNQVHAWFLSHSHGSRIFSMTAQKSEF